MFPIHDVGGGNMYFLGEMETIAVLRKGHSIARFGNSEFALMAGSNGNTQTADPQLKKELIKVIDSMGIIVAVPPVLHRPVVEGHEPYWRNCALHMRKYLVEERTYGSAFITRGDVAPHIQCDEYWNSVRMIWDDRQVILVRGVSNTFNKNGLLDNARDLIEVETVDRDAWQYAPHIIEHVKCIAKSSDVVVLSLGAAATVLARTLSLHGLQALDLGYMGRFYSIYKGKEWR
jgi:hypothetical protein